MASKEDIQGLASKEDITGVKEDMKAIGLTPGLEGKRVVIQGLGNVGYFAAQFFQQGGATLVGLAASRNV